MNGLSLTAEEILELVGRVPVHADPEVNRVILKTDIGNAIWRSEMVADLKSEVEKLSRKNRQLERDLSDLEDQPEDE